MIVSSSTSLNTIGVVGAGAMGGGIAQVALAAGLQVVLYDANAAAPGAARVEIRQRFERLAEKRAITPEAVDANMSRLTLATSLSDFKRSQLIVEAIVERLDAKRELFVALEAAVSPDTVLATNTSSLSVAAIALPCKHRERICGLHFFNPVPLMKLVEVISAAETGTQAITTALELVDRIGKVAVQVRDVPGFLVNLLGRAYVTESLQIEHEGVASVETIDRILRDACGFRMGPFELMDLTGVDVNWPATNYIYEGFQHDPRLKSTIHHRALLDAGHFGRKSGRGFHRYDMSTTASVDVRPSGPGAPSYIEWPVYVAQDNVGLKKVTESGFALKSVDQTDVDILIAPDGEDAASAALRLRVDPMRVVAVDCVGIERRFLTLMAPLGVRERAERLARHCQALGFQTAVIADSPGFVAPRVLAMIANLGCEVAQAGIGTPKDIDLSMRLAQNYPKGPLEWAEYLGVSRTYRILQELQGLTGSDRYRPSMWLRQRAQLGLPAHYKA
jgi:3-hydroxybutyryl-CoA dehydrogenase